MSYDPTVPNQSNFVRGASGDLVKMRDNFVALAPILSGAEIVGSAASSDLIGWTLRDGSETETDVYQAIVSGGTVLHLSIMSGGQWRPRISLEAGVSHIGAFLPISGQAPTQSYHLVTRAFVDALILDSLANVVVPSPVSGEGLIFNGTNWVPGSVASALTGLSDVALSSPLSGQALIYNGTQWTNGSVATTLSGLGDVDVTGVVNGNTLIYSGGIWRDGTLVSDHGGLTGLGDDDHPQYSLADGTRPFTGTVSGITPTLPAHLATKAYVDNLSGLSISGATTLSGLTDVSDDVDLQADGSLLTLSGGNWYARPAPAGADILQIQIFS